MAWQKTFTLAKRSKGCHLVTEEILSHIESGLSTVQIGMLFLFIQHTSAALTVNENYDRDVRRDMDMALDNIVPETLGWRHTDEGPDDSYVLLPFACFDQYSATLVSIGCRTPRLRSWGLLSRSRSRVAV
jgi:secondary thiamine-phosphate synthase enzyme